MNSAHSGQELSSRMNLFSHADPPHHGFDPADPPGETPGEDGRQDPPRPSGDEATGSHQGPAGGPPGDDGPGMPPPDDAPGPAQEEPPPGARQTPPPGGRRSRPREKSRAQSTGGKQAREEGERRTLPSSRSNPDHQIQILITLAALDTGSPVSRDVLGARTGVSPETAGEGFAFFADLGLTHPGRGRYRITDAGRAFAEMWPRDRTRARLLLQPLMQQHWSAPAAARLLADGPLPQEELARRLQKGLSGNPVRGRYLVEWLDIALIVIRDERLTISLPGTQAPPAGPDTPGLEATLLGMKREDVMDLPAPRFAAFLDHVVETLRIAVPPAA